MQDEPLTFPVAHLTRQADAASILVLFVILVYFTCFDCFQPFWPGT